MFLLYVPVFGHKADGILAPLPGIKPATSALEGEVLTTGPPGKSPLLNFEWGLYVCSLEPPNVLMCCCCSVTQSCPAFCDPMGCSRPDSSVCEISQARILPFPSPGDLPNPGIKCSPALEGGFFTTEQPTFYYIFFKFYFIFKLYNNVLVLENIEMDLPQVYMCSPS